MNRDQGQDEQTIDRGKPSAPPSSGKKSQPVTISEQEFRSFEKFFAALHQHRSVGVVRLDEYEVRIPVEDNGATFFEPVIQLVATAFFQQGNQVTLCRWADAYPAREIAMFNKLSRSPLPMMSERDRIEQRLLLEGYTVEPGEWTPLTIRLVLGGGF